MGKELRACRSTQVKEASSNKGYEAKSNAF